MLQARGRTDARRSGSARECELDCRGSEDAEQPQDENQDDDSAKADIHDIPPFCFAAQTVCGGVAFQSLQRRIDSITVLFYP
jgi:hypothetical protein